jgi:hypothetical protein
MRPGLRVPGDLLTTACSGTSTNVRSIIQSRQGFV